MAVLALLFWQAPLVVNLGTPADPEHMLFQRAVVLPPNIDGTVCAVLDAKALAHTASIAHNDLRLFSGFPHSPAQVETPYTLTESGPEPVDAVLLHPEHMGRQGDTLHFELEVPKRAYSELQLQLDGEGLPSPHNFLGTVTVTAIEGRKKASLGTFGIFDLSSVGLGKWTNLLLAETTTPVLHFQLSLRTPSGEVIHQPPLTLVTAVAVPPSRARQTAFVTVAGTRSFAHEGRAVVATLTVPSHVPVEAVRFELQGGAQPNFARQVTLSARSTDQPFNDPETLDAGTILHVRLPSGDPRLNPIAVDDLRLPATLGATLAGSATVQVSLRGNQADGPALRSVLLEMRERRICFHADPGKAYTLRYGDPALAAPLYTDPPALGEEPIMASLGPELQNPFWVKRQDRRSLLARHPELFWLLVLACTGMMGGTLLQFVQQGRKEKRG